MNPLMATGFVNMMPRHPNWRYDDQTFPHQAPISSVPKPDAYSQEDKDAVAPAREQRVEVVAY